MNSSILAITFLCFQVTVTAETSAGVASQLAVVTSDPVGLTVEELSTVVGIAEQLILNGRSNVQVHMHHFMQSTMYIANRHEQFRNCHRYQSSNLELLFLMTWLMPKNFILFLNNS